jgi:Putative restriction endonuclease
MLVRDLQAATLSQPSSDSASESLDAPVITWEKLPVDFILPDDPVDNLNQYPIADALSEILRSSNLLKANAFTFMNYGLIATVNGKTIAKAPDWAYVPNVTVSREEIVRSYTPYLEGDVPTIVLEIISATDGGEYSKKRETPMGKWYFYEQVMKVPYYAIFEPDSGDFELYRLDRSGTYDRVLMEESGRYWIEGLNLTIAAWKGTRDRRSGYWLRFWDSEGTLLPWLPEILEMNQQELGQTQQVLGQTQEELGQTQEQLGQTQQQLADEKSRADRLAAKLRSLGIEPD